MRLSRLGLPFVLAGLLTGCGEAATGDSGGSGSSSGASAGNAFAAAAGLSGAGGAPAAGQGGGLPLAAGGMPAANVGGNTVGGAVNAGTPGLAGAGGRDVQAAGAGGSEAGRAGGAPTGGAGSSGGMAQSGMVGSAGSGAGSGGMPGACTTVSAVPEAVRDALDLDAFYEKYVDATGLAVLGSGKPSDESLRLACQLLNNMLGKRDDVRQELIRRKARFAIIGKDEGTAEIPEYGYRGKPQSEIDYINARARGLGGQVASCGEENILCLSGDRYPRESICVHEFSHTISTYGVYGAENGFQAALDSAYDDALASGILDDTYRNSNLQEYWAEGVQDWYDTNDWAMPPNGIHNDVNTRVELESYDPILYALIAGVFPEQTAWGDCRDQ